MEMAQEIDLLRTEVARLKTGHVESERQLSAAFDRIGAQHKELCELETMKIMVDDVLVVNWINFDGKDYRDALSKLVCQAIEEHDDPAISLVAADRSRLISKLLGLAQVMLFDYDKIHFNKDYMTPEYLKIWSGYAREALELASKTK